MDPISRSTYARCHGARGAERTCLIPIAFTCAVNSWPKIPVSVPQQITRHPVPGKRLAKLLSGPLRGGMRRNCEMNDAPAIVCQHQKYVQDLEPDCRYHEEVHRYHALIIEKRTPTLRRWFSRSHHVLGDGWLGDLDAEFQQLPMDARCAPTWVVATHHSNQIANLLRHTWSSWLAVPALPSPEQTKAFPMPSDDRFGLNYD